MAGALSLGLVFGLSGTAQADKLDDQKKQVKQQISQSNEDLHEYNQQAVAAANAYSKSQADLAEAQSLLASAQSALSAAQALDAQRATELAKAQTQLNQAKLAAVKAAAEVSAWEKESGARVRAAMQQQNPLANYASLFSDVTVGDLNNRGQWAITVMDSTSTKLDQLRQLKLARDAAQAKAVAAEKKVAALRAEAANELVKTQTLASAAAAAQQSVAAANAANAQAKSAADAQVKAEQNRQVQLQKESKALDQRIAARLAAQKAAAAKAAKEAAAKAAAAKAAAAKAKAEAAAKAAQSKSSSSKSSSNKSSNKKSSSKSSSGNGSGSKPASNGLIYPSSAAITSAYGMRFHPVLHVWKLHDGTDFGASCGSPIRAAADGVVSEKYYNAGYGNRLIIDHGQVNGRYMTTAYNHATRYIVSAGQKVRQGQVVGYVGSTGYSTGCHLHLMLWVDGDMVNPMNYF